MNKLLITLILVSTSLWGHQCKNIKHENTLRVFEEEKWVHDTISGETEVESDIVSNPYERYINTLEDVFLCIMFEGEYIWMRDEVSYSGSCVKVNNRYILFDHRDTEWAVFDIGKNTLYEQFSDRTSKMEIVDMKNTEQYTVAQRLLIKKPYLTWYGSELQFTIATSGDLNLSAYEVEALMDFIRSQRGNLPYNEDIRYQWYDSWQCAFEKDPVSFNAWLKSIYEDLIAAILFVGSIEVEVKLRNQTAQKLEQFIKSNNDCFLESQFILAE